MKINEQCLPCLVNQAIKVANLTNAENREELYKKIFGLMSHMDFSKTNPEIVGESYQLIKRHIGCADPYKETKNYYNQFFLANIGVYDEKIHSIEDAVKYTIVANIIDFNPVHSNVDEDIQQCFSDIDNLELTINDVDSLLDDIQKAKSILYLGDNCGEICFDKLLIKRMKDINTQCQIYFGVRGEAVVNDNTEEDAYFVGMDEYATIISNGDYSLGTIISHASPEFREIYRNADVVIAEYIGVKEKALVCMRHAQSSCKGSSR